MSEAAHLSDAALVAELVRRAPQLPDDLKAQASAALAERSRVTGALAGATGVDAADSAVVAAETPFARFETQYEALPKTNILAQGSTWEQVQARLSAPANADKLKKVLGEMDEPRLYAVMEDGSLEFVDGNPDTPPMFVKENATGTMQIIYKRDPKQMETVSAQITADTHQWASTQEMLDWAEANGFEVFAADTKDGRRFGNEMKLAEAASPTKLLVGKQGGPWRATALKDARCANFFPGDRVVSVRDPRPTLRDGHLGLLRRLRV